MNRFQQSEENRTTLPIPEELPLQFVRGCGYWISPAGSIFAVETHIKFICHNPELFGLTSGEILRAFEEQGELYCSEGNARRELILAAVQKNAWVRVRHYIRRGWTVNLKELDKRVAVFFLAFAPKIPNEDLLLDFPHERRRTTVAEFTTEYQRISS